MLRERLEPRGGLRHPEERAAHLDDQHRAQPLLDWLRRPQQEATGEEYDIAVEAWQDDAPGPLERLAASSEAAALERCLQQLDGKQRQSIMLAFFHGLSHSEVAGHMKQPLGTVKTWVRRGLERLKGCLQPGGA